ncbi:Phosphatidylinositol alpha-mannosyltransferase [Bifidobacterium actinocoloniiforme DSM 22766]|uniref:Phosphatidylinositol alpha-mannosyltransferase n=1 Tax=Bifidobacterium actinocoloniiforme DSM 22766 TaxID=1437605 RepID=A0A086Z010_9BIFI|nr:glycosyltransferase family 4 protein [Bifidobacterium actinocoloniiforme]AKV55129.1 phosphatidyl-myo-inositol alpha-mannosyltransferase [Bifidobacterium actinocoloniiforme DSM 22766]KFI39860.1 Phosphatidylinositol alpha-mannosyltransferase [Bifidobacterium actinocoloniiforme DSM 22766]
MRPLKVGFVFDDSLDAFDGVQQHILTLGRELERRGHEVHYLVGQTEHPPVRHVHPLSRNVQVSFNGNRMRIPLLAPGDAIRRALAAGPFDILHVQAPYSPLLAGRVLERADPRTGLVATYHIAVDTRVQLAAGKALGAINSRSHRLIDEVIAVSQVAARYAQLTAGVRGVVIPNPVDVTGLQERGRSVGRERVERLHGQGPHLVFLGRFVPRKGARALLDALAWGEAAEVFPPGLHVTMAGKGPLLEECRRRAEELRTPVEFPGFIEEGDKPALLASADLAVFPSTGGESFGIVLLEAIASGAALSLAGDNPGYRSTLLDDEDALVPVGDEGGQPGRALAERIARALAEPAWSEALARRERGLLKRYDVKTVAAQVEGVYARALADRGRD